MIKGISKQVMILSGGPNDFYEEAIFVLKDACIDKGINEKRLIAQAQSALGSKGLHIRHPGIWKNALFVLTGFAAGIGVWLL